MKYKKGYKYKLAEDLRIKITHNPNVDVNTLLITLDVEGNLLIRKGYAWDGPSGPTIDTKSFMRGSLVHDALYQLMRMQSIPLKDRILADKELKEICEKDGMSSFRAWYIFKGVRAFGRKSAEEKVEIYVAP